MITIRSPIKKTLLLITLTTLTISLGAALSWESPSPDQHINETFDLNVSGDSGLSVEFYYDEGNGWQNVGSVSESSGNYITQLSNTNLGSTEELNLKANTSDSTSGDNETSFRTITLDTGVPSVSSSGDTIFVGDNPTVDFDVSDDYSDVIEASATASSGDGDVSIEGDNTIEPNCNPRDTCGISFEIDASDLGDGDDFQVEVSATDEVGKSGSQGESYTVDTSWDGDSSANVEWDESISNVLTGFVGEDQDVSISFQPDTVSDTSLTCEADGTEVDTDFVSASDEEESASCRFDYEDYASSNFDLNVEAEDEAGNSQTLVDSKNMVWDTEAPNIDSLGQPEGVSTFNSEFNLQALVSDDASGILNIEYYFDANTQRGNGNSVNLDDSGANTVEKEFTVTPGDLGQGEHTVYVRAEDGTGQTVVDSFDFEYFPDRDPSVNLGAPDSVEVTSGDSTEFKLNIENGAPFFLNGVEVKGNGAVWNGAVTATNLEEGDSVEKTVTIDASELEVGEHDLTLETSDTGDSTSVNVVVRATESQKQNIDSDLKEWQNKRTELENNISQIGTLEPNDENITQFTQKLNDAKSAIDSGNYYQAKAYLEDIDSSFNQASDTYEKKLGEHKKNKRNELFMILLGSVVLLGGGVFGFLFYRDGEMELDPENLELPDELPEVQELGVVNKIKDLFKDAEEEIEEETGYNFEGFN